MSTAKDWARALRYRRLALAETDRAKAELLNQLADEAERGVLCTADRTHSVVKAPPSPLPYGRGLGGW
jgi:hypothetical protein